MVRNTAGPVNSQDLRALLNKDAVYNAVGLAAFDLYDEIDFDRWLVNGIEQVNLQSLKIRNYCTNFSKKNIFDRDFTSWS